LVVKGNELDITENGENGTEFSDGEMIFLDFAFQPNDKFDGQFTLNILGNVADKEPLEIEYGRRGAPFFLLSEGGSLDGGGISEDEVFFLFESEERVEIYDFDATYQGESFDLTAFYHTPRYHWKHEGDFFGLVAEATDIGGMDIWNAKAPEGVEFAGKGKLEGLKIIAGPEVYWGANPKVVLKYQKTFGKTEWAFMHSEDLARRDQGTGASGATTRKTRQTTLYAKRTFADDIVLEVGGLLSAGEKVDDAYTRYDGQNVILDEIEFEDTLGFRAKLTFPLFGTKSYIATYHAGLVADGGAVLRDFGVTDPTALPYSSQGNKQEYEAGMMINFGDFMLYPRVMYRDNLDHANPFIEPSIGGGVLEPGISPRDTDSDPFAVLGNREARSAEVFLTYDPTGASFFYDWDNEWAEDAKFAFNIGGNYTEYPTFTDAHLFFFNPTRRNVSFGQGLPSEDVWSASSRMVFNPSGRSRYILNLKTGYQQSTGNPDGGTRKFHEFNAKAVLGNKHVISGYFKKDAWGPYDFQRQFNVTFPEQYKLDYQVFLDGGANQFRTISNGSTSVGIRALYRTNDPNAVVPSGFEEQGEYIFQTVAYFTYRF
jgi:beta-galactosidase